MSPAHLTPQEKQALQEFANYLRVHFGTDVQSIALFGSKARGDSHSDSDVDVLVILRSEDRQARREILKQAARLSLKYDILLSPRVIGTQRWAQMRGFSFYQNVQQEAISLPTIGENL